MSDKDKKEVGCAYAAYASKYNDKQWGYGFVAITLTRRYKVRCENPGNRAAEEEHKKINGFKELCETKYPILAKMEFDIGCHGTLMWQSHGKKKLYQHYRRHAWAMWHGIPQLERDSSLIIEDFLVDPLPGPWRWRFL